MSRIRLSLLGILVVLAVGAIASASASAANCVVEEKSGKFTLCLGASPGELSNGENSKKETNKVVIGDDATHKYILTASGVAIECTTVKTPTTGNTAVAESGAGSVKVKGLVLEFSGCTVGAPATCKVKEPIVTEKLQGKEISATTILFFPEAKGTTFATLTLENNGGTCTIAGKDKVTTEGKKAEVGPLCSAANIATPAVAQLFECLGKNSHLEFINKPAEFSGQFLVELFYGTTAEKWSVIEGS